MSELIDNRRQKRINDILNFSIGVMEGKDVKELIDIYGDSIREVTPHDIIIMEDKQIQKGIGPKKIKKHIEKILNILGPYLGKYSWNKPGEGHPLHYFMEENRALEKLLSDIKEVIKKIELEEKKKVDFEQEINRLKKYLKKLKEFDKHYIRKENILFPYLEKKWIYYRPLQVMWSLHDDIREHWKSLDLLLEGVREFNHQIRKNFGELFLLMYRMIFKEEKIIFPIAIETLNSREWEDIQNQSYEIGFSLIQPPVSEKNEEKDIEMTKLAKKNLPFGTVLIGFETGALTLAQITTILNKLPVDITYVDENDIVKYFSRPEERIFPRSSAIIGRTVQNCHPPESVHIVNKILDAFKTGKKNRARFWIQMKGKFILIEYFALRDNEGNYMGTLEVSQDITEIRKLDGEKRLLDWE